MADILQVMKALKQGKAAKLPPWDDESYIAIADGVVTTFTSLSTHTDIHIDDLLRTDWIIGTLIIEGTTHVFYSLEDAVKYHEGKANAFKQEQELFEEDK